MRNKYGQRGGKRHRVGCVTSRILFVYMYLPITKLYYRQHNKSPSSFLHNFLVLFSITQIRKSPQKMGTISCYFPAPPLLIKPHQPLTPPFPLPQTHHKVSRKLIRGSKRVHSTSKFGNFLDLKPENKPEALNFDLPWCHPSEF